MSAAERSIQAGSAVAHDVADEFGQILGNVGHMAWFIEAVAERIRKDRQDRAKRRK